MIDLPAVIDATRRALPGAQPFAAVPLFVDQVRWLDVAAGVDLVERLAVGAPPRTWRLTDEVLDAWPAAVAARALEAVRALPPGADRIEALCLVARRLSPAEQDEALTGILDGTCRERSWDDSKGTSRRDTFTTFLRTLPSASRELWVRAQASKDERFALSFELRARRDVGCLTEAALRELWARQAEAPTHAWLHLGSVLPADLRGEALARVRACPDESTRLSHLADFDEELTDAERTELVEVPSNAFVRRDPSHQARYHLRRVARHLPKVAPAVRRRWLAVMLGIEGSYDRQVGLLALLPSLDGEDRDTAVAALLAVLEEEGVFHGKDRWDLLSDDALPAYLVRLREDEYGWHRDGLVEHILAARPAAAADRILPLLLEGLDTRPAETVLEIVRSLTPWLADRTAGAAPRALAALPIPTSDARPDAHYMIARVLAQVREGD